MVLVISEFPLDKYIVWYKVLIRHKILFILKNHKNILIKRRYDCEGQIAIKFTKRVVITKPGVKYFGKMAMKRKINRA